LRFSCASVADVECSGRFADAVVVDLVLAAADLTGDLPLAVVTRDFVLAVGGVRKAGITS